MKVGIAPKRGTMVASTGCGLLWPVRSICLLPVAAIFPPGASCDKVEISEVSFWICETMAVGLGNIDLKQIHAFLTVVESGGFGAAQGVLNVSPSRLSTMISDLERRLGMRLCQRGRVG